MFAQKQKENVKHKMCVFEWAYIYKYMIIKVNITERLNNLFINVYI